MAKPEAVQNDFTIFLESDQAVFKGGGPIRINIGDRRNNVIAGLIAEHNKKEPDKGAHRKNIEHRGMPTHQEIEEAEEEEEQIGAIGLGKEEAEKRSEKNQVAVASENLDEIFAHRQKGEEGAEGEEAGQLEGVAEIDNRPPEAAPEMLLEDMLEIAVGQGVYLGAHPEFIERERNIDHAGANEEKQENTY